MTPREAIIRLNYHFRIHDEGRPTPHLDEAERMAIEALEKQIPKKILPDLNFGKGKCPSCKAVFLDKSTNYCGNCGQRIDWGELNELDNR